MPTYRFPVNRDPSDEFPEWYVYWEDDGGLRSMPVWDSASNAIWIAREMVAKREDVAGVFVIEINLRTGKSKVIWSSQYTINPRMKKPSIAGSYRVVVSDKKSSFIWAERLRQEDAMRTARQICKSPGKYTAVEVHRYDPLTRHWMIAFSKKCGGFKKNPNRYESYDVVIYSKSGQSRVFASGLTRAKAMALAYDFLKTPGIPTLDQVVVVHHPPSHPHSIGNIVFSQKYDGGNFRSNPAGRTKIYPATRGITLSGMHKPAGPYSSKGTAGYRHRFKDPVEVWGLANGDVLLKQKSK